jgi:hypothetical protein
MAFFNLKLGNPLSFSIVLCSRKVVGDYVKKQLKIKTILDAADHAINPHLPDCWWLLRPILMAIYRCYPTSILFVWFPTIV